MPPKAKITREMIIEEAFEIARKEGAGSITARRISEKLGCSTQPVLYYFSSVEDIKAQAYKAADEFHTRYLMNFSEKSSPMHEIGLNYIRFAAYEKNLFKFLFQTNEFAGRGIAQLIDAEELTPVLNVLKKTSGVNEKEAKEIFMQIFMFVHGYASMLANNDIEFDEKKTEYSLANAFKGAVFAVKGENDGKAL